MIVNFFFISSLQLSIDAIANFFAKKILSFTSSACVCVCVFPIGFFSNNLLSFYFIICLSSQFCIVYQFVCVAHTRICVLSSCVCVCVCEWVYVEFYCDSCLLMMLWNSECCRWMWRFLLQYNIVCSTIRTHKYSNTQTINFTHEFTKKKSTNKQTSKDPNKLVCCVHSKTQQLSHCTHNVFILRLFRIQIYFHLFLLFLILLRFRCK